MTFKFKKSLIASIAALAALASTPAHAALIEGTGFWFADSAPSPISGPGLSFQFSFEVDEPIVEGSSTFYDAWYTLQGEVVTPTITDITFFDSGAGGLFDISFSDGSGLSLFGEDFTANPAPGFYLFDAFTFDGTAVGGVTLSYGAIPEASTWAMMILGLGFAGAAMRRRSQTTVTVSYA